MSKFIFIVCVVVGLVFAGLPRLVAAQGGIRQGHVVICDTPEQVRRLLFLIDLKKNVDQAINQVNDEEKSTSACGFVLAAFIRSTDKLTEVKTSKGLVEIVKITVIAVLVGNQWHLVTPLVQYIAMNLPGKEARFE